jgi:hypothetical protein
VFGNPAEGLVCGHCGNSYLIHAENPEIIDGKGVWGERFQWIQKDRMTIDLSGCSIERAY